MNIRGLRFSAVALAVLALIDPAIVAKRPTRPPVNLMIDVGPSMELPGPEGPASRLSTARRAAERIRASLPDEYDMADGPDSTAVATVAIGDRYPEKPVRENILASTVTVSAPIDRNVRIVGVSAPRAAPPLTAVHLVVVVEGTGLRGQTTSVAVRLRGTTLNRVSHAWTSESETWRAELDVIPFGPPPFRFDVAAEPSSSERTSLDNAAVIHVDQAVRLRIHILEARPSWTSAFIRRALEQDPRFEISGVSHASPRGAVRTGQPGGLPTADVVIVGGLDALTSATANELDAFARDRGGAVVLVPDSRHMSPAARHMVGDVDLSEVLLEKPGTLVGESPPLARLDASELLETRRPPPDAVVLQRAAASGAAVVWVAPHGDGNVVFSGAMDAWRFRASASNDFDRFWRGVIAGLALEAIPLVSVDASPRRAAIGERIDVVARVRRKEWSVNREGISVSARVDGVPVRLLPSATDGVFTGSFVFDPPANDSQVVTVELDGTQARGSTRVTLDANAREDARLPLSTLSATHGGIDAKPSDVTNLVRHLRSTVHGELVPVPWHPLRSTWTLVLLLSIFAAEWWLRRRAGLR